MAPARVPEELLRAVVACFDPARVSLFGSHARGDAGLDSDYDLLVVPGDDSPAEARTLRAGFETAAGFPRAADVVPVRPRRSRRGADAAARPGAGRSPRRRELRVGRRAARDDALAS